MTTLNSHASCLNFHLCISISDQRVPPGIVSQSVAYSSFTNMIDIPSL